MKLRKYDQRQLEEAVKSSTSFRQALEVLVVAPYGGNYEVLKKAVSHFSLDTSHFTGQHWNKGKAFGPKQPPERFLNNELKITSLRLLCPNCHALTPTYRGKNIAAKLSSVLPG